MRITRFFIETPLASGQTITLPPPAAHYALNVLRLRIGTTVTVFNGHGGQYSAHLTNCHKKTVELKIEDFSAIERESPLKITLVTAIARPEHCDYTIQKAVELGVTRIVPVITERSPPLDTPRMPKREQHWRKIIIGACEQCGRNRLPELSSPVTLSHWLTEPQTDMRILLSPQGQHPLPTLTQVPALTLLNGAEGGLSADEIHQAVAAGYLETRLGPRILRTETAAVVAIAICQALWGDVGT